MTTQNTEERIAHLKSVTLPESSRTRMREELSAYADMHSLTDAASVASGARTTSPYFSHTFSFVSASFFRITTALVVLVGLLGGTAYAANDAQPGQTLYPVKLNLTEPVQTALIPSTEGKAAWHAILAERRLEEATNLAVAGKLDPTTQGTITDNFTQHVQDSSNAAAQLQQEGNVSAALNVRSDLEARITAHEDILTQVVTHLAQDDTATTSESATKNLLSVVHDSQSAVTGERLALEDSINLNASTTQAVAIAVPSDSVDGSVASRVSAHPVGVRVIPGRAAFSAKMGSASPMPSADSTQSARAAEVSAILFKNSALLKFLGVSASTTSSTTIDRQTGKGTASSTDATITQDVPSENAAGTTGNTQSEINIKK